MEKLSLIWRIFRCSCWGELGLIGWAWCMKSPKSDLHQQIVSSVNADVEVGNSEFYYDHLHMIDSELNEMSKTSPHS